MPAERESAGDAHIGIFFEENMKEDGRHRGISSGRTAIRKIIATLAMCLFLCFIEPIVVCGVELLSFYLLDPTVIRILFWIGGLWGVFCCLRER